MNLTGGDSPEQLSSGYVTADFFRLFGAQMAAGRTFTPDEDRPNAGKVVVLSHGFWQRRFGGDPGVVGRTIPLGGDPHVVVAILARSFDASQFEVSPDVWTPFQMDPASNDANYFTTAARRVVVDANRAAAAGESAEQAEPMRAGKRFTASLPSQSTENHDAARREPRTADTADTIPRTARHSGRARRADADAGVPQRGEPVAGAQRLRQKEVSVTPRWAPAPDASSSRCSSKRPSRRNRRGRRPRVLVVERADAGGDRDAVIERDARRYSSIAAS
jgi:hypothetical protein